MHTESQEMRTVGKMYLQFDVIACLLVPVLPVLLWVLKEIARIAGVPYSRNYRRLKGTANTTRRVSK